MGLEDLIKRYVITGAQYQAGVNHQFLDSLDTYAKHNNAEILVLPIKYKKTDEEVLHERLQQYRIVTDNLSLNSNLQIAHYAVRPQSIEPITGFSRFAKTGKTTIFASPKQRLKVLPNHLDLPKVLMTTGFVTKPQYDSGFAISSKARADHKFGAIVVEVEDKNIFHYRHVDSQVNGKFYDLGVLYDGKKMSKNHRGFLVLGDYHGVDVDPQVHQENLRIIERYKPVGVVLHDLFDGQSINHWSQGKSLDLAREYNTTKLSVESEVKETLHVLKELSSALPRDSKIYVVKSNHDERIDRWLNEGRYLGEPQNYVIGHRLWLAAYEGKDPLYTAMGLLGDVPKNVEFLSRTDQLKKYGVELGFHGDERMNGGRGSIASKEHAYGKSVTAHVHSPEVLRDTYVVGTNTKLNLGYNSGNSGWMHTSAFVYPNGKVQMFNYIKGKHRSD